jgi:hypothetical protein
MGRIAYGLGIANVSWAVALFLELSTATLRVVFGRVPSALEQAVYHHATPALLAVLPIAVACAVLGPKAPGRRHLAAFVLVPLAFAVALFPRIHLESQYLPYDEDGPLALIAAIFALVLAAVAALPLAPILWFARAGESDDHDVQMRLRIGISLAVASAVQLVGILLVLSVEPSATTDALACAAPSSVALVFGLVEDLRNRRVLASLQQWLSRVRAGAVHGVRVRAEEAADSALYIPDLVTAKPLDDIEVLEVYAENTAAGPYRMKRSAVPVGRVPRVAQNDVM